MSPFNYNAVKPGVGLHRSPFFASAGSPIRSTTVNAAVLLVKITNVGIWEQPPAAKLYLENTVGANYESNGLIAIYYTNLSKLIYFLSIK
jgi:hypothetical protein